MKEVEGLFGTSVVSYFIFLRFLFVMNLVIFALWFGFVVTPGIVYVVVNDPPNVESQLACAYEPSNLSDFLCPTDDTSLLDTNDTLEVGVFVYQVVEEGMYSCTVPEGADNFLVRGCEFASGGNDSIPLLVADRESNEDLNVSTVIDVSFDAMQKYLMTCSEM